MNMNQVTFREMAGILTELGITGITDTMIEEAGQSWDSMPEEVRECLRGMKWL